MTPDEFNDKLDRFGKMCGNLGLSGSGIVFDPMAGVHRQRMAELRDELRLAFREKTAASEGREKT